MVRVLLTGADGFLGRPTSRALEAAGYEVHSVSSRATPEDGGSTWHRADLLDPAAIATLCREVEATHLVHLAWHGDHDTMYHAADNVRWAAAGVTLLDAFQRAGGCRAVLAGSCAEYDWSDDGDLDETGSPIRPATIYGRAKDGFRRLALAYAAAADLPVAWVRPFFVYGPGGPPNKLVTSVARALRAGERAPCSHGRQVRDYVHVDDVAAVFAALVGGDFTGVVNVGRGEGHTLREIADEVARQLGRPGAIDYGALPSPPDEPRRIVADIRRLRDEVGCTPSVDLVEGVRRTLAATG